MKITFFMEDYYLGGLDTFVTNLINNWPDDSDLLTFICNNKHTGLGLIEASIKRPCTIIRHNLLIFSGFFELAENNKSINNFSIFILKLFSPILKYVFLVYNIFALRKILLQDKPDHLMIINGGYPGGDSCRAASITWGIFSKKPYSIHNFHGIVLKPRWHKKFQEFLVDRLVSYYTKVFVTVSQAAADSMLCRDGVSKKNKIYYIHNGIEAPEAKQKNNAAGLKKELGIPDVSRLCLMLGSYHRNKNFDKGHYFLFQAFKKVVTQLPSTYLLVCGFGSDNSIENVRQLVLESGLVNNVRLSGFRKDIPDILEHTDILLIASQTFESFCFAAIEAMAHRVPVVATRVGAIPEVIATEGGYCVEKDDTSLFADYIIRILKDDDLKRELGQKGFARYNKFFTARRMAEEYAKLIHNG